VKVKISLFVEKRLPNAVEDKVEYAIANSAKCQPSKNNNIGYSGICVIIKKMDRSNPKVIMTFIIIIYLPLIKMYINIDGNIC